MQSAIKRAAKVTEKLNQATDSDKTIHVKEN